MNHPGRLALLAVVVASAVAGCRDRHPDTMSRERFVEVNVALRRLNVPGGDSAATRADSLRLREDSARARARVLREEGVTEKELQTFVDARRNDTEELAEAWREIAAGVLRADSVARMDSIRADSVARADSVRADSLARRDTVAARDTAATRDTLGRTGARLRRPGPAD